MSHSAQHLKQKIAPRKFRPILRPDFRRSHKKFSPQFCSGNVRRNKLHINVNLMIKPQGSTTARTTLERKIVGHNCISPALRTPPPRPATGVSQALRARSVPRVRSFEKGWRTEGVGAKKSFPCQRLRPLFCTLFPMPPLGEGGHISGEYFGLFFGVC